MPDHLAREACEIEIEKLGQQIGIQDQFAVAYGGFNRYIFNSDGTVSVTPAIRREAARKELVSKLMLFFTGKARDSREIFIEQKAMIRNQRNLLDSLVQATEIAQQALNAEQINVLGDLLKETWEIKKHFSRKVSNSNIDEMYETALDAGAVGGKILGAGGGGFMLLFVPEEKQKMVTEALVNYKMIPFEMDAQGSRIIFSD